jgi:hypothetical protein
MELGVLGEGRKSESSRMSKGVGSAKQNDDVHEQDSVRWQSIPGLSRLPSTGYSGKAPIGLLISWVYVLYCWNYLG